MPFVWRSAKQEEDRRLTASADMAAVIKSAVEAGDCAKADIDSPPKSPQRGGS